MFCLNNNQVHKFYIVCIPEIEYLKQCVFIFRTIFKEEQGVENDYVTRQYWWSQMVFLKTMLGYSTHIIGQIKGYAQIIIEAIIRPKQ